MLNDKELQKFYETHDIIDDSKMPSPEEVAAFPPTPEIDKILDKKIDEIAKKFGIY